MLKPEKKVKKSEKKDEIINSIEDVSNIDNLFTSATEETEKEEEWIKTEEIEKIDPKNIHTLYFIKNGVLHIWDLSELEKKNYKYRLYSLAEWIAVIDYDKTDARPLIKDILNRTGEFLEIKLLRREFWMIIGIIFLLFFTIYRTFAIKPADLWPIAKWMIEMNSKIDYLYSNEMAKTFVLTGSTTETKNNWYNPILPKKNTPNTTK